MSIYKRGSIYWTATTVNGDRYVQSLGTTNRREAERREHVIKEELRGRPFRHPELRPEMTLAELYARFLAEGDIKPHHRDRAKRFLGYLGEMAIGNITKNEMARYRKHRQEDHLAQQSGDDPKPLSDATVNRDISVIRHLLYWALDEGYIQQNPLTRFRMTRERRKRRSVMPVAHEVKLLASCAVHLIAIIILALDTGMRRGELFHQRWEDVDFERGLLFVTLSKTPEGEMREIPLTSRAFELLSRFRQVSGLLFTYKGEPMRTLKTAWTSALRRAGLPHYRFHDLRHTFNSRLVEVGIIADVRKELMGHSRGGDTHSIYTHVELPLLRDAIARLDAWLITKLSSLTTAPVTPGEPPNVGLTLPPTP